MKVCGIEMGDAVVIVGVDDEAMVDAMRKALERSVRRLPGARGVTEDTLASCRKTGDRLCLYDLGDSMHPTKYRPMVDALRASGVPFVATTHSPYLLDCFSGDEVIVLHEGRAARLSQHPQWPTWATLCNAGEFWSAEGEAWVANVAAEGCE